MKVLIAYDGSDEAKKAIEALAWSELPRQAEALVIAPVRMWPPVPQTCFRRATRQEGKILRMARSLARLAMSEALATAREGAERVELLFPEWKIQSEACAELSPVGLQKRAEEWGADYLLASDGRIRRRNDFVQEFPVENAGIAAHGMKGAVS